MNLFKGLNFNGVTIVLVTHDISVAEKCQIIIELEDGNINLMFE